MYDHTDTRLGLSLSKSGIQAMHGHTDTRLGLSLSKSGIQAMHGPPDTNHTINGLIIS